jgi:hypothetical protein
MALERVYCVSGKAKSGRAFPGAFGYEFHIWATGPGRDSAKLLV